MITASSSPSVRPHSPLLKWVWICGWGVHPDAFNERVTKLHPTAHHTVIPPTPRAFAEALQLQPDVLAGYSLGTLLILSEQIPVTIPAVFGVAPIFAFDAEAGQGGLTPARSRLALIEKFKKSPLAAIRLYLRLAGMADCFHEQLPYVESDLAWGLEALGALRARAESVARATLFAGENDPMSDAKFMSARCSSFHTLPNGGHDYRHLLPFVFNSLPHARI